MLSTKAARQAADLHYLIARPYRELVLRSILQWVDCNGFDWTANRCKSVWLFLSHRMQSSEDSTPPPAWVGVAKFLSYPLQVLKGPDEMKKLQLLQLWRIFTSVGDRKTAMAPGDKEKFLRAVLEPAFYPDLDSSLFGPEKGLREEDYMRVENAFKYGDGLHPNTKRRPQCQLYSDGTRKGYIPNAPDIQLPVFITVPVLSGGGRRAWRAARKKSFYALQKGRLSCRKLLDNLPNWLPELFIPSTCEVRNPMSIRKYESDGKTLTTAWKELVYSSRALFRYKCHIWPLREHMPFALRQIEMLTYPGLRSDILDDTWRHGNVRSRIQKDGKVRFYQAAPKWAQWLMEPWGRALYKSLSRIPQDCTYEQSKGVRIVQRWLKEGRFVYSIDLSSATDRFPLALTMSVLGKVCRTANQRMWLETFGILSRLPTAFDDEEYRRNNGLIQAKFRSHLGLAWSIGQPLGSYPSFAAFALTHHAVARAACSRAGYKRIEDMPYVILGDDIVFGDRKAADEYERALRYLDVPVSKEKCLSGGIGEFAGRIILKDEWEYKAKYFHVKPESLLSAIEVFGPRALRMMPKSPLRDVIALLPTSRTPGGVNPGGFPRALREKFLENYFELVNPLSDDEIYGHDSFVDTKYTVSVRLDTMYDRDPISLPTEGWPDVRDHERLRHLEPTGSISNATSGYHWPLAPYQIGRASKEMIFKPYRSRAWLRKVVQAARSAGLLA